MAVSRERRRARGSGFHVINPVRCTLSAERAVVESSGEIHIRPHIHGVECDVVSWGRFFSRAERRNGQWRLASFDSIYVKDRIDPVLPDAEIHLDADKLAAARPSYRHLAYLNRDAAYPVPDDLPGEDRPDLLDAFYADAERWMVAESA